MNAQLDSILAELEGLQARFDEHLKSVHSEPEVEALRVRFLARKGELPQFFKRLGELSAELRPQVGQRLNQLRDAFEAAVADKQQQFDRGSSRRPRVDLTLPGIPRRLGTRHPLLQLLDEMKSIFVSMGFAVESGALAETDYYNFEALNIPQNHPSRDLQDTFYLSDPTRTDAVVHLLRTHTSPVQIHAMEHRPLPIRIIAPGRVFRNDAPDATHSPVFHQIEGLWVDEGVTMSDLKGVLFAFARRFFGGQIKMRFRPSYFPFTEPSAELDIWFPARNRWLEILGCGMVNPAVFERLGIDAERYTGFAFGIGVERLAMTRYAIDDIRIFYDNDVRFLRQF